LPVQYEPLVPSMVVIIMASYHAAVMVEEIQQQVV
jgi:hypothetical protein